MNILSNNWRISRRHALRGLGVSLSLPMLDCMRLSGAEKTVPRRSAFIYLPNGVNTLDWQITKSGTDFEFTKPMQSLEPFRNDVTPISGLYHPNGIGNHHNCQTIWLSSAKIGQAVRKTVSVDQVIAEKMAPETRFPSLELSISGKSLAWSRDGIQLPPEQRPANVFKRMFEVPDGGIDSQRRFLQRQGSILDVVINEAGRLNRKIGSEDKSRLDQYLTSVREVEIRTERADNWLDVPPPEINPEVGKRITREVTKQDVRKYFETFYDLMALSFQTDMTRVISFMSGDESLGLAIPEININQTRHALSHHNGDPEQLRRLTESDTFNIEMFAYFLGRLKSVSEGDRTLLDQTAILYGSGMAYGHSHGNANLPLILAGGKKLGYQHGRHVDLNEGHFDGYDLDNARYHYGVCSRPVNSDAHLSNLLLTMAQRAGVENETFGDSNRVLSEV